MLPSGENFAARARSVGIAVLQRSCMRPARKRPWHSHHADWITLYGRVAGPARGCARS